METLVFATSDVIYRQVLRDIKVLEYLPNISKRMSVEFDDRFKSHIEAIYNNSPMFFKVHFMETYNGFKDYQKYYYLLHLILYCSKHDVPDDYKHWAAARMQESINYLIRDPYPNEQYGVKYEDVYKSLIFPNDPSLSVLRDIRNGLSKDKNGHSLKAVVIELGSKYLELKGGPEQHLVFDYRKMSGVFREVSDGTNIKYSESDIPVRTPESLENTFNKYDSVSLKHLSISANVFDSLQRYHTVYIVFPTIHCNCGYLSSVSNVKGNVVFSGRFIKENDMLFFKPFVDRVPYVKNSCSVKSIQFYITTENDKVIPYTNIQEIPRKDIYNIPFKLGEGDTVLIHAKPLEIKYSIKEKMIRAFPRIEMQRHNYVLKRQCNYAMCGGAKDILVRFDADKDYGDIESFTMSQVLNDIAGYTFVKDKGDIYHLTLKKMGPTYFIVKQSIEDCSAVYNHYKCSSDIVNAAIGFESYAKAVLFVGGLLKPLSGGIEYVKYLLNVSQGRVIYREAGNSYMVVSTDSLPEDIAGLHLRIVTYNMVYCPNIHCNNGAPDSEYYEIHIGGTDNHVYVKLNEKFILNSSAGTVYVLKEDGRVYSVANPKTYGIYIENASSIYEEDCYEYSNIGGDFPEFNVGERVMLLSHSDDECIFDDNAQCEIYKNDSPYVQFKNLSSSKEYGSFTIHELGKSFNCKNEGGIMVADERSPLTLDNALTTKKLTISASTDVTAILTLS